MSSGSAGGHCTVPRGSARLLARAQQRLREARPYLPLYHYPRPAPGRRPFEFSPRRGLLVFPQDIFVTGVQVTWPSAQGAIKEVKLDGARIFNDPLPPPRAPCRVISCSSPAPTG